MAPPLTTPLKVRVNELAPHAYFELLNASPVVGSVVLGMEQAGVETAVVRPTLIETVNALPL